MKSVKPKIVKKSAPSKVVATNPDNNTKAGIDNVIKKIDAFSPSGKVLPLIKTPSDLLKTSKEVSTIQNSDKGTITTYKTDDPNVILVKKTTITSTKVPTPLTRVPPLNKQPQKTKANSKQPLSKLKTSPTPAPEPVSAPAIKPLATPAVKPIAKAIKASPPPSPKISPKNSFQISPKISFKISPKSSPTISPKIVPDVIPSPKITPKEKSLAEYKPNKPSKHPEIKVPVLAVSKTSLEILETPANKSQSEKPEKYHKTKKSFSNSTEDNRNKSDSEGEYKLEETFNRIDSKVSKPKTRRKKEPPPRIKPNSIFKDRGLLDRMGCTCRVPPHNYCRCIVCKRLDFTDCPLLP